MLNPLETPSPRSAKGITLPELRCAYDRGLNIMDLIRHRFGLSTNDQAAVLMSYELQAGSYIRALEDREFSLRHARYVDAVSAVLRELAPRSLLEAGVGEATTLAHVAPALSLPVQAPVYGFDLSWSRIHCASRYWRSKAAVPATLFVGELEAIPLPDSSFDVVFTAHAVEPNHGRESLILRELYRVANRFVVLFEPAYEFAGPEAKARMEHFGYCRDLAGIARQERWNIVDWRLLDVSLNQLNPTGVLILEKPRHQRLEEGVIHFACPVCRRELLEVDEYFCEQDALVFPRIKGIPCLSRSSSILAAKFRE